MKMYKNGEKGTNAKEALPFDVDTGVFGGFDQDDPDFAGMEEPPRPRSRISSRTSSSSSLIRNMSSNSLVRFYLGNTIERHPSGGYSSRSSIESLSQMEGAAQAVHDGLWRSNFGQRPKPILEQCHSCCVRWDQGQFSFDCNECGGYTLERDCPECQGECTSKWKRDLNKSHAQRKAAWIGTCNLTGNNNSVSSNEHMMHTDEQRFSDSRTLDGSESENSNHSGGLMMTSMISRFQDL